MVVALEGSLVDVPRCWGLTWTARVLEAVDNNRGWDIERPRRTVVLIRRAVDGAGRVVLVVLIVAGPGSWLGLVAYRGFYRVFFASASRRPTEGGFVRWWVLLSRGLFLVVILIVRGERRVGWIAARTGGNAGRGSIAILRRELLLLVVVAVVLGVVLDGRWRG